MGSTVENKASRVGWTHRNATFQIVSDAITFIIKKHGATIFAYIDDFVGITDSCDAMHHFNDLHVLLQRLDLHINEQKLSPSCKTSTFLGIYINIPQASLSIDQGKLMAIHMVCFNISTSPSWVF